MAGVTQVEVAQALGTSQGQISRMERQQDMLVSTLTAYLVLRVGDTFTFGGTGELRSCTWPMRWNYAQVIVAGWIH
jgi:transcriptional regulator with XRE-family HTH domain